MDVNNAFLYGDLVEEFYMRAPLGFALSNSNNVCQLHRAPRNWFAKLTSTLKQYGIIQFFADYFFFTYPKNDVFLDILIYVEDLILTGNNSAACLDFKFF